MKKSLFLLLLLTGFSAYALNGDCRKAETKTNGKSETKKAAAQAISPLADLFSFIS